MRSKPRIAFSLPNGTEVGGVTTWTLEMCRRLRGKQRDSTILLHRNRSKLPVIEDQSDGVHFSDCTYCEPFRIHPFNLRAYAGEIPATFVPNYGDGTYATCAALTQAHAERMRVVGYCHTFHDYYFSTLKFYEPIIHRFVAVSEECAQALKSLMPHRREDVVTRPYGVNVPKNVVRECKPATMPLNLLYAGRIVEKQKRVSQLPKLAEELVRQGVNFHLRIVGNGQDKPRLLKAIDRLDRNVKERISVNDHVSPGEITNMLRASDVCVLVSDTEGTSVFMLEGMAQGCVPVVTKVSGTAKTIRNGVNGYCIEVGDLPEMATAIRELADDRERLKAVAAEAHRTAQAYSYDEYFEWFQNLSDDVWEQPPRSWPESKKLLRLQPSWLYHLASYFPGARTTWNVIRAAIVRQPLSRSH